MILKLFRFLSLCRKQGSSIQNIPKQIIKEYNLNCNMLDNNKGYWSEIEHLICYLGTDAKFKYDIIVHTSESLSNVTKYARMHTDERVPFRYYIRYNLLLL